LKQLACQERSPDSNLSITRSRLSRQQQRAIGPLKVPEKRRKAPGPDQWPWRAHPFTPVVFFPWIFPRCRASKKAAGGESRPRKIHRDRRHWQSRSVLTPPIEKPWYPGKQSSCSFPLSSRIFPPLSSAPLILIFSLSVQLPPRRLHRRPVFFSFFVLLASSLRLHLEPGLFLSCSYPASLLRRDDDVVVVIVVVVVVIVVTAVARAPAPRSLSLLSPSPLFCFPGLPSSSSVSVSPEHPGAPRSPPSTPSETISSSPLLLPRVHRLATCYPDCLRYEARHTATWKEPRNSWRETGEEEEEERDQTTRRRCFLRY